MPIKYIYILIYLISCSVAIAYYKKIKGTKMMLFLYILLLGLLTESTGYYIGYYSNYRNTFPIYNLYYLLSFIAYFFLFRSCIQNKIKKRVVVGLFMSFILFMLLNYIFTYLTILKYHLNSWMYGDVCMIIIILIYLLDLFQGELILNVKHVLLFWVSVGNLLFFVGSLPVGVLSVYFNYNGIWDHTVFTLNIIMHTCFITGFLISKREYNIK